MSLVPRDPLDMFMPLRDAMNRLFEESFISPRVELFTGRTFPLDVYESPDKQSYVVEASLAGFKPDDIQVMAEGDVLTISVSKKTEEEKKEKGNYVRRERFEGEMVRTITLPTTIDVNKVSATYEHGVLKLQIPKEEAAKAKQIPIKVKEAAGTR